MKFPGYVKPIIGDTIKHVESGKTAVITAVLDSDGWVTIDGNWTDGGTFSGLYPVLFKFLKRRRN